MQALSSQQLNSLSLPFPTSEILKAIDNLPLSKSPGKDGIPDEYYKYFKHTLVPHLVKVYNTLDNLPPG